MKKTTPTPPKYAQKFLQWLLKEELIEEVLGDLEEKYYQKIKDKSIRSAKANYYYQTLNYLRPFAIKNNLITDLNPFFMFNSYFKIAWRSLFKQKLYSSINITGMTIGMTCFILIVLYIQYELSYDLQHENADRIYRVAQQQEGNTFRGSNKFAVSSVPVAPTLSAEFPEVAAATTIAFFQPTFRKNGQAVNEFGICTDTALFDVFTYPVLEGDVRAALKDKDGIILTSTLAKKYFGNRSPIGQTIEMSNKRLITVKAVIEDVPDNQHFGFNFITSLENYGEYKGDRDNWRWASNNYRSYVVLKEGANVADIEKRMIPFGEKAAAELAKYNLFFSPRFFLQPITDIHLYSNINFESGANGDIRYLYLAASIAFIILLLALINYMNLATARTSQRSKEVGVRKVLGAQRKQLVNQFMLESMLVTGISFVLAMFLVNWSMPAFNQLMDMNIPFDLMDNQVIFYGLIGIALLLGLCSGLYPAILSSAIAPIKALKGGWLKRTGKGDFLMRNALVIGQFTAAIVLAISSVVIYQQLDFIQTKKLGYNREQVIFVSYANSEVYKKSLTLKNELRKHANIEEVTITSTLPINANNQGVLNDWEGKTANDNQIGIYRVRTDYDFLDVFEMEMLEGRNFSRDFPTDSTKAYIVNESAVEVLGWTSAIGKSFRDGKVIGVVKDFHFQPFDLAIEPMQISFRQEETSFGGNIAMKVKMNDSEETLAHVEKALKTIVPEVVFNPNYLDDAYNNLYQKEQRFGDAFNIFTFLALFIACIGLFGLVTHNVSLRTKEIGIRKVLGASVTNIVAMVSKDFLKLVTDVTHPKKVQK